MSDDVATESVGFDFESSDTSGIQMPGEPDPEPAEQAETAAPDSEVESFEEPQKAAPPVEPKATPATPATPAAKQLTFKVGETAIPVDETAVVEWKVDGKPTPVAVKDLLQNYAGKVAWEKRLNDVALERKNVVTEKTQFEADRNRHKSLVTNLHTKMQQGKTLEAVSDLVQMTGLNVDPREYVKGLRDLITQQAQQLAQMSPEDRARYEINEEREYVQTQRRAFEQQRQVEQAKQAFEQRLVKAQQASGLQPEEFSQTYNWLFTKVKEQGGDPAQVTPEYVQQHASNRRAYEVARDVISSVEPDLIDNGLVKDDARWDKLAEIIRAHPEFSQEELTEMYRESRQSKLAKTVSKKVNKAPVATAATGAIRAKPKTDEQFDWRKAAFSEDDLSW